MVGGASTISENNMEKKENRPITLGQKTRELILNKLKLKDLSKKNSLWDWQEGAKDTLNPIPAMIWTLKDICRRETNILNIIYNSWLHIFRHLFSKHGIYWRQSNGCGSFGSTHFKIWTLTYHKEHTVFEGTHSQSWKSKKFLFSKHWLNYDYEYVLDDFYGCSTRRVSQKEYEKAVYGE